jgi:hypothetical protein
VASFPSLPFPSLPTCGNEGLEDVKGLAEVALEQHGDAELVLAQHVRARLLVRLVGWLVGWLVVARVRLFGQSCKG